MRKELEKLEGQRDVFVGRLAAEGSKAAFKRKGATVSTILLKEIRRVSDKKLMCDHLWLNKTKALAELDLTIGADIQFAARVKQYSKGYLGRKEGVKNKPEQDFKLSHPTQFEVVGVKAQEAVKAKSRVIIRKPKIIK